MNTQKTEIANRVVTACTLEVLSPKPGNVSPGHNFSDATVADFLKSAAAIAPVLASAAEQSLGRTILNSVTATRKVVEHNTNLGIILLLAPLAAVPADVSLSEGMRRVLENSTIEDARQVYAAIRTAQPSGLGESAEQDVRDEPGMTLRECMILAAGRDMIAAQYANGFRQILNEGLEWLQESAIVTPSQPRRIAWLAVRLMSEFGDTLIARKCGAEMSESVRSRAQEVLASGWPNTEASHSRFAEFDRFLRADENQRNPGTTADFIAAILFAGLREGVFVPDADWDDTRQDLKVARNDGEFL